MTATKPRQAGKILARVPIAEVLQRLGYDVAAIRKQTGSRGNKIRFVCPKDKRPNPKSDLEMRLEADDKGGVAGEFKCFSCNWSGDFAKFYAEKMGISRDAALADLEKQYGAGEGLAPEVDRTVVGDWHKTLITNDALIDNLERLKGIKRDTMARRWLGYESAQQRYSIPIFDADNRVVNVRRYKPGAVPKMINMPGHGAHLALYPRDNLTRPSAEFARDHFAENAKALLTGSLPTDEPVILTEGEMKALILEQFGFRAVSATGGANVWNQQLSDLFTGRKVYIAYDMDEAGKRNAYIVAKQLNKVAAWVGVILLPLPGTKEQKDVTDYFIAAGYGPQDFANLMLATQRFTPRNRKSIAEDDSQIYQVSLRNSVKAQYSGKCIETDFVVASKDSAPFIVPNKIRVACDKDQGDLCQHCAVFKRGKTDNLAENEFELADADEAMLRMLNVKHEQQEKVMREIHGIASCRASVIEKVVTTNVEHMKLVPAVDLSNPESTEEDCSRVGYRVGFGIEPNAVYRGRGYVLPEPQTQSAVLMFTDITPAVDSLTEFKGAVTDEELSALKVFQPTDQNSVASIQEFLNKLHADLSMNVTGIYDRNDMHLFMDLAWHSVLYLPGAPFGKHEPERGWCDMLVIGDTRQGKTETAQRLRQHYGVGSWAPAKICTRAGLIGNAQQVGTRWHIAWGMVPSADRQLVVIEEAKGMDRDVIQQMTDVRSSGKAMLIMVETATTYARTRLLWLSNPRSDRSLDTYPFGVEAVKELIGAQEDVSRFTAVMAVASGEVDEKTLTGDPGKRDRPEHFATSALCRRLVLWAWTRGSEDIEFTPEALETIREVSSQHTKLFSAGIPLVEPADHRFKLARLSAALAARLFSCDKTMKKLVITAAHVKYIGDFLTHLYSKACFAYDQWSAIERSAREIRYEQRIKDALVNAGEHYVEACRAMLSLAEITNADLEDLFGIDRDKARDLMAILTQGQCIRRRKNSRYKTPAFNKLLKELLTQAESGAAPVQAVKAGAAGNADF